jgi:phospholipid/cholesterol/gamma-HCH transport system substrate-binding protein
MNERIMQFRVGVLVLATLLIGGILLVMMGEFPTGLFGRGTYDLEVPFDRAPGVTRETPVRKSGILIGRVSDVRFADDGSVIVTLQIHDDVKLRRNEIARIKGGIMGDAVIEFVPADPGPKVRGQSGDGQPDAKTKDEHFRPGERLPPGVVVNDPLELLSDIRGDLKGAITTFNKAGEEIGRLATTLNKLIDTNDEQVGRIMGEMEVALQSFNRAMNSIQKIAGDEEIQEGLRRALADLPRILDQSQQTFRNFQGTIDLTNENLTNLKGFTGPLGQRGDRLTLKISDSVDKLDQLLGQMVKLGNAMNTGEGSLGRFLSDPDLYQSLLRSSRNIEDATKQLRPILNDARGLVDKLNRHPGSPIRDAIRPGAGTK